MTKPKVYLETSMIGYVTSRLTNNLVTAAHQVLTRRWWETQRSQFDLYTSSFVLDEIGQGDPEAAADRLRVVTEGNVVTLDASASAGPLAKLLISRHLLPKKAEIDAVHVSMAAIYGMDYLLTWNCTHIANAAVRDQIATSIREQGYHPPILCTPEELMGGLDNDSDE